MAEVPDPAEYPEWLRQLVTAVGAVDLAPLGRPAGPGGPGRPSAVLVLFGPGSGGPDVLLIQRAEELRSHAGQPAFPGGAADPTDRSAAETALREAAEEVGLDVTGVRVIAELPQLYLAPSNFLVTPVLGWWERPSEVSVVDPAEVARVERVPIAELVDPANRFRVRHSSGVLGAAFDVRGMLVWGFTAGLLDRLLVLAGWARPWDAGDVRDLPARIVELARRSRRTGAAPTGRPPEHDAPAADDVVPPDADGLPVGADQPPPATAWSAEVAPPDHAPIGGAAGAGTVGG